METLLEPIVASPKMNLILKELTHIAEEERKRREQFYNDITPEMKAEFINGEVVVQSPARRKHLHAGNKLLRLLSTYVEMHELGEVVHEKALVSLTRNDYEPDICFFEADTAAEFTDDQWQFPAPDFVVEILSASTEAKDRGDKMIDYAAHGVGEYWLVDTDRRAVERYRLEGEAYTLIETVTTGVLRSDVVTGFAIPIEAIFDPIANQNALRQILQG
jgi:Uma2 family endonuclease